MTTLSKVFVTDPVDHGLSAEHMCMLSSKRSRSMDSVNVMLDEVIEKGPEKFLKTYYLGYGNGGKAGSLPGHGSICQSGSTTVEIENVSMLAAVAFEDHGLFRGQECSTRYIKMGERNYVMPHVPEKHKPKFDQIINSWYDLYELVFQDVYNQLKETQEKPEGASDVVFDKALRAAALDKASGFLPCATKTSLSWHTDLDNANTQVQLLKSYPLQEVRTLAGMAQKSLMERYQNSIKEELPEGHREYYDKYCGYIFYSEISTQASMDANSDIIIGEPAEHNMAWSLDKSASSETYSSNLIVSENTEELLMEAPKYMYLPNSLKNMGYVQTHGCLDFASFRDLHRHRDGNIPVPYLSAKHGIHSWYLKGLTAITAYDVSNKVNQLLADIKDLQRTNPYEAQYLMPMAIRVPVEMNCQIPQFKYIAELRSGHACREPLRMFAQLMASKLKTSFPNMALYANMEPAEPYFYERGNQDIRKVNENGEIVSVSTGQVEGHVDEEASE